MPPRSLALASLFLAACSGGVEVDPPAGGSGGAGGSTTSSPSTAGAGGAGEGGSLLGGGGSAGATTATSEGGAGGAAACDDGWIHVDIDGNGEGPPLILTSNCLAFPDQPGAVGVMGYAGKGGPMLLFLHGCDGADASSLLDVSADIAAPGTTTEGTAQFELFDKPFAPTTTILLEIATFGEVGGRISGDVSFDVAGQNGDTHSYTAVFDVCRLPDYPPPP